MVRFFEKQDKEEIISLARDFLGNKFNKEIFSSHFDEIIAGEGFRKGISVLHAGEYLGYCVCEKQNENIVVKQLYIKPAFQKLKVAPQVLDFIKEQFPGYVLKAACPQENTVAIKLFLKNGFDVI